MSYSIQTIPVGGFIRNGHTFRPGFRGKEEWKEMYDKYSSDYIKTNEDRYWENYLTELVPGVFPFRCQTAPRTETGPYGTYTYDGCVITYMAPKEIHRIEKVNTYIHELCHHTDRYHIFLSNKGGRSHSKIFKAAINILQLKNYCIHKDEERNPYLTRDSVYLIYGGIKSLYTLDELSLMLGFDLQNMKVLD